jgi:hypothetical protein
MFDQLVDGVRKAAESSMQLQQEMFRQWTRVGVSAAPGDLGAAGDWNRSAQRRWLELALEVLNKHRAAIDSTYKAGIQIIEQTFHLAEATSVDDSRKQAEDLWRKVFEAQKERAESQLRDFQTLFDKSAGLFPGAPQA